MRTPAGSRDPAGAFLESEFATLAVPVTDVRRLEAVGSPSLISPRQEEFPASQRGRSTPCGIDNRVGLLGPRSPANRTRVANGIGACRNRLEPQSEPLGRPPLRSGALAGWNGCHPLSRWNGYTRLRKKTNPGIPRFVHRVIHRLQGGRGRAGVPRNERRGDARGRGTNDMRALTSAGDPPTTTARALTVPSGRFEKRPG